MALKTWLLCRRFRLTMVRQDYWQIETQSVYEMIVAQRKIHLLKTSHPSAAVSEMTQLAISDIAKISTNAMSVCTSLLSTDLKKVDRRGILSSKDSLKSACDGSSIFDKKDTLHGRPQMPYYVDSDHKPTYKRAGEAIGVELDDEDRFSNTSWNRTKKKRTKTEVERDEKKIVGKPRTDSHELIAISRKAEVTKTRATEKFLKNCNIKMSWKIVWPSMTRICF